MSRDQKRLCRTHVLSPDKLEAILSYVDHVAPYEAGLRHDEAGDTYLVCSELLPGWFRATMHRHCRGLLTRPDLLARYVSTMTDAQWQPDASGALVLQEAQHA